MQYQLLLTLSAGRAAGTARSRKAEPATVHSPTATGVTLSGKESIISTNAGWMAPANSP
jgi:hypothetical protein